MYINQKTQNGRGKLSSIHIGGGVTHNNMTYYYYYYIVVVVEMTGDKTLSKFSKFPRAGHAYNYAADHSNNNLPN